MADIAALKAHVSHLSGEAPFIHRQWFVEHHLSIIEQLVEELLERYPAAEKDVTRAMVWVHDWGKIITNKGPDEDAVTLREITTTLPRFGFTQAQIDTVTHVYHEMEELKPLGADFLIETKIISSADGFAHYVGPFFAAYFYETPHKTIDELVEDNQRKIARDEKKILLPDVRQAAEPRMQIVREYAARNRPLRYLS